MAKRKLSAEQRTKLREELAAGVKEGTRTPELLEAIAKKYGITTITARWYLKSIGVKPKRRKGKPGRPPGSKNGLVNIDAVHSQAQEAMQRAKEAKRLYPRWQKLVKRQGEMKKLLGRLPRKLARVESKSTKLRKTIGALIGA